MRLVHNQQIPRGVRRDSAIRSDLIHARPLEKLLKHVGHPQVIHRRDDARKRLPRIRVDPESPTKLER